MTINKVGNCIVLYCIVSINLYSASCSAHQSEALIGVHCVNAEIENNYKM